MQNGWVETMYIHLKIYEIICCFLNVFTAAFNVSSGFL